MPMLLRVLQRRARKVTMLPFHLTIGAGGHKMRTTSAWSLMTASHERREVILRGVIEVCAAIDKEADQLGIAAARRHS